MDALNPEKPKFDVELDAAGLTQAEYCRLTGRSRHTVGKWYRGIVKDVPVEVFMMLEYRRKLMRYKILWKTQEDSRIKMVWTAEEIRSFCIGEFPIQPPEKSL